MSTNWNSRGTVRHKGCRVQGIWVPPPTESIPYQYYEVESEDVGRLDLVSYKVYGYEYYFWVIAAFNNIMDPFNGFSVGQTLKIPNLHSYLTLWQQYGFQTRGA